MEGERNGQEGGGWPVSGWYWRWALIAFEEQVAAALGNSRHRLQSGVSCDFGVGHV